MENSKLIQTETVLINASREKVWDILFNRFGQTHLYNPNIMGSHDTTSNQGEVGCERQCNIDKKTFIREKVIGVEEYNLIVIDTIGGNMPLVKHMQIKIKLEELSPSKTKVNMEAEYNTKPAFMAVLVRSMFKKMLTSVLIGLKYYLETGKTVSKENYKVISKEYYSLPVGTTFNF
ncbi:MAG: SRPBCC family protein [Bacteroidia bacterium]|uniref:SRPBCC family protein n=1 Tax=Flavobacterium sp. TaxID=239 RepID=UPI0025B7F35B|nr:SRPBCC family protein [Flavobacterium sp.]MCK6609273.1 SRPBCC family protein [Flavobacterium sp.]MCK6648110.1 SRPBCC family protein [Bacteroidia bacterium]